ncbi:Hypothetical predicted protein [Cloeon dipterum]|uniref:Uncharacterized protein n=1 Tax=Cloeon dipterum TaxID=197152 RepID=A0A8S1CIY7_9INSE|nr:Hypothetical predicted protein [Cloeon dipterum]
MNFCTVSSYKIKHTHYQHWSHFTCILPRERREAEPVALLNSTLQSQLWRGSRPASAPRGLSWAPDLAARSAVLGRRCRVASALCKR